MTLNEVFRNAADKIERDGWWNGDLSTDTSSTTCIWLALSRSAENHSPAALLQILRNHLGAEDLSDIYEMNDSHSAEWAINTLRQVADNLEKAEANAS